MKSEKEIKIAIVSQKAYCAKNDLPHFAPEDGVCWNCRKQIYEKHDGQSLVTGCRHCNKSYCD